jgi:homogentisate 1,2-dioxygenase
MARQYLSYPLVKGQASRQAHCDLPEGTFEREMSKEGFFGPAAFFYHPQPPTGWTDFEGPMAPRAFDLVKLNGAPPLPWDAPVVLKNAATEVRFWRLTEAMTDLARNADGDQLLFVHQGTGDFYCDFGHLSVRAGDYIVVPRGSMWRVDPHAPMAFLLIEATGSTWSLPDKGLVGPHAIFDPAMLDTPELNDAFRAQQSSSVETKVRVKRRGQISTITYPFNPLDAIGWHGDLSVARVNIEALRPLLSARYHLPPSAHTTFLANRVVVCTFAPRPFETDPGAIKVPFFHNNDDYDEVIFYHAGDFFSRDNIHPGMMTYHPSGFTHGPHPKALGKMLVQTKAATDEYAVMIDTRDPLEPGAAALAVENPDYKLSWKARS